MTGTFNPAVIHKGHICIWNKFAQLIFFKLIRQLKVKMKKMIIKHQN